MSGPKVVRLVTLEEILEICATHLRQLDCVIASWIAEGKRTDTLTEDEIAATHARRKALEDLVAAKAFMDLQKMVPDEIVFLKADLERRRRIAVTQAEQAAKRRRQLRHSARTLLDALRAKSVDIPSELQMQLDRLQKGNVLDNADALFAQGFSLLSTERPRTLSDAQKTLANSLLPTEMSMDFAQWRAEYGQLPVDPAIAQLDKRIAEAHFYLDAEQVAGFSSRLSNLEAQPSAMRQSLLIDSLTLDVTDAISEARAKQQALAELDETVSQIQIADEPAAADFAARVVQFDVRSSLKAIVDLTETGRALILKLQRQRAAEARRGAILMGLAKLGYEVTEGMHTAWAKDGRVIVKKSSLPGYGVEIGGQAEAARLQVRAVSLTETRDTSRDKDVETLWCGEFGRLQALLAEQGDNLLIERALGVGEVPLKVIADVGAGESVQVKGERSAG